jgi:hypothetical protein
MALSTRAAEAAQATATIADAARHADERDRLRRQYERIGDLVEGVFFAAEGVPNLRTVNAFWMEARNRLRHALVGLHDRLPKCVEVLGASSADQALRAASDARGEVEKRLRELDESEVGTG